MPSLTPFQTVGPYLSLGLRAGLDPIADNQSSAITIRGRLIDGGGQGIPDGVLEWWHPALPTVQRSLTGADGGYSVQTQRPPAPAAGAPHFAVRVLARGILTQYSTRLYFSDAAENAGDVILNLVPAERRHTLIAEREAPGTYHFDVVVQGDHETVFFDI